MKRFVTRLILFIVIVTSADVIIGRGIKFVTDQITIGGQGRDNYIANIANEDILVFGSSRAVHHYNSQMLEDSLGLSCYNCGQDGAGIILSYGRLLMIKERHHPKTIIVDITPEFDLSVNDNHKYLGWLKLHYEKKIIHPIFDTVDKAERFKMKSFLYRYNSIFLQNIVVYLLGRAHDDGIKGFRPTTGSFDRMKVRLDREIEQTCEIDAVKKGFIYDFIEEAGDADLYFVVSPIWYGMPSNQIDTLKAICQEKSIPFLSFANDENFVHHDDFFKDGSHLNSIGADIFTKELIDILKKQ